MEAEERRARDRLVIILTVTIVVPIIIFNLSTTHFAAVAETQNTDCTRCHSMSMWTHRFPTAPCISCHSPDMATLTLRNGTVIPIEESNPLCVQCHTEIFQAWMEGKHGTIDADCVACHNPHSEDRMTLNTGPSSLFTLLLQIAALSGTFIAVVLIERIGEKTRAYE